MTLYSPVKKRFFIHRLVAQHFCEGYQKDLVVNHKDGNKLNNCANNLEWVTRSENDLHAFKNNLRQKHILVLSNIKLVLILATEHYLKFIKMFKNVKMI